MNKISDIYDIKRHQQTVNYPMISSLPFSVRDAIFGNHQNPYQYLQSTCIVDYGEISLKCREDIIKQVKFLYSYKETLEADMAYEFYIIDQYVEEDPDNPDKISFKEKIKEIIDIKYKTYIQSIDINLVELDDNLTSLISELDIQHKKMIEEGYKILRMQAEYKIYDSIVIRMEGKELFSIIYNSYHTIDNCIKYYTPYSFFKEYFKDKITNKTINMTENELFDKFLIDIVMRIPEISIYNSKNNGYPYDIYDRESKSLSGVISVFLSVCVAKKSDVSYIEIDKMLDGKYVFDPILCQKTIRYVMLDYIYQLFLKSN